MSSSLPDVNDRTCKIQGRIYVSTTTLSSGWVVVRAGQVPQRGCGSPRELDELIVYITSAMKAEA